jgi:class 3 adenylate cyclase
MRRAIRRATKMIACPGCGFDAPDDSAFCSKCGSKLASANAACEERKTVTTLFCDLVAFTAMSEAADPEDVDRILGEYFARATRAIESHGGTVEKFIGDAVVGVFGVPAAHEDDPERAVRVGLRLIETLEGMTRPDGSPLQVRIGVNTGEALVRLDVDPTSGRGFLTGDAVNTAARLEASAPPGGVAVGGLTHELTSRVIDYEELPPVHARGKTEPVSAWRAIATVARRGIELRSADLTPLVGRKVELSYLSAVFETTVMQSSPQLALIVGEPGIGKSRLVRELSALVDARPEMTIWRQGYCPPFGEDITYGALADIVRGHAGIRDKDSHGAVAAKLEAILPAGPDRDWFRQRLRALLGSDASEASREANFAAWMRFLEELADGDPTVLVFEDLHWADEALLAFIEYLTTHVAAVPLLLVATARPELFERQPGFASTGPVTRVNLGPLSAAETTQLVAGLLGEPEDRVSAVGQVVERCEGNPFYAEQSAHLLADTSLRAALPDSIQAVIAARLDTLPADEKTLLADASVVGSVFWQGAVAAIAQEDARNLEEPLTGLLQHHLIRRIRESSMEGEREFAFVHALARDVAYGQLPRIQRAKKHAAVATWIQSGPADQGDEIAELLAHHYFTAYELAHAAGEEGLSGSLRGSAVESLTQAGTRALPVDVEAAARHYGRALELVEPDAEASPKLLQGWAKVLELTNRPREAARFLETAIELLLRGGDRRSAAVATCELNGVLDTLGEGTSQRLQSALDLLADDGPSAELAHVLAIDVGFSFILETRSPQEIIDAVDSIVRMCGELGLPLPARALHFRGGARIQMGDRGGIDDYEAALAAAQEQGLVREFVQIQFNSVLAQMELKGAIAALERCREGLDAAVRRGDESAALGFRAWLVSRRYYAGEWDEALSEAAVLDSALEEAEDTFDRFVLRHAWAIMLAERGEADDVKPLVEWLLTYGRGNESPWFSALAIIAAAVADLRTDKARAREHLAALRGHRIGDFEDFAQLAVRTAIDAGDLDLGAALAERIESLVPLREHMQATSLALLAEATGAHTEAARRFAAAVSGWHDFCVPYEEAQALFGQGRCLVALGRAPEAAAPLAAAREIFARLGAKPALTETDEWLARVAE